MKKTHNLLQKFKFSKIKINGKVQRKHHPK